MFSDLIKNRFFFTSLFIWYLLNDYNQIESGKKCNLDLKNRAVIKKKENAYNKAVTKKELIYKECERTETEKYQ